MHVKFKAISSVKYSNSLNFLKQKSMLSPILKFFYTLILNFERVYHKKNQSLII